MPDKYDQFTFPELSREDNQIIINARRAGFAMFFPAFHNAKVQSERTLDAAKTFLSELRDRLKHG